MASTAHSVKFSQGEFHWRCSADAVPDSGLSCAQPSETDCGLCLRHFRLVFGKEPLNSLTRAA